MTEAVTEGIEEPVRARGGKYLTLALGDERYGIRILKVREIIGMVEVSTLPRMPDFVRGVIDLRGKIIPVVDLRRVFDMPPTESTRETCIIVVDILGIAMGIVVDRVVEVAEITEEQIENTPTFGTRISAEFMLGIAKTERGVTILLDIDKALTSQEIAQISSVESVSA